MNMGPRFRGDDGGTTSHSLLSAFCSLLPLSSLQREQVLNQIRFLLRGEAEMEVGVVAIDHIGERW